MRVSDLGDSGWNIGQVGEPDARKPNVSGGMRYSYRGIDLDKLLDMSNQDHRLTVHFRLIIGAPQAARS